jgi:hypothetical protein
MAIRPFLMISYSDFGAFAHDLLPQTALRHLENPAFIKNCQDAFNRESHASSRCYDP